MTTIFRARRNTNAGSGGKLLRGRRASAVASPYGRPNSTPPTSSPPPENPNWLLGLVIPASRMIVNGAGKLVSTVFGSNDDSPSSSDWDDTASSSEDEADGDDDSDDTSDGFDSLNQSGAKSDGNEYLGREPQAVIQRSETKLEIERLLMQETFSRDECNRLTKIIQSRVVECHTSKEGADVGQNELPDRTIASGSFALPGASQLDAVTRKSYSYLGNGFDSPSPRPLSHHHTAIMEAKRWLEDKNSESCSKLERGHLTFTRSPFKFPNVNEGEVGSPVVMAKTYMQSRPPWASPSASHAGFKTPSPIGMHLVKGENPHTIGAHYFSSSKFTRRSSLADDSWNILSESRRVRCRSEKDTLQPNSSMDNQSSALELERNNTHTTSRDGKQDAALDGIHDSDSLPTTRSLDSSMDLPAIITRNGGLGNQTTSVQAITVSKQNQGLEDLRFKEGEGCSNFVTNEPLASDSVSLVGRPHDQPTEMAKSEQNLTSSNDNKPALQSKVDLVDDSPEASVQQDSRLGETVQVKNSSQLMEMDYADDSRQPGKDHPSQSENNGTRDRVTTNGAPLSASSLSAGLNIESGKIPENEESSESKSGMSIIPVEEETCELLSEASVEIPDNDVEEKDTIASDPQTNSSRFSEDLLQIEYQTTSRKSSKSRVEKQQQQGKRIGRYSRRGRGRGK